MADTVEQHLARVLSLVSRLEGRDVPIMDAAQLVLDEDITAGLAVPPFTNSSMDGFAVRRADVVTLPCVLPVSGDVPAGTSAPELAAGTAMRVMTGAPVPDGADLVVPVELTDHAAGVAETPRTVRIDELPGKTNIRRVGEDVAVGDLVLPAGSALDAAALAAAVSVGRGSVRVVPRPRVLVVTTGTELVDPGAPVGPGQIPDSNQVLLASLLADVAEVTCVRCDDDADELLALLDNTDCDLVVSCGGVSAGAFDVVKAATARRGVEFAAVAMQPGKPQASGRFTKCDGGDVLMLGLPGNPVSVFVSTQLFVLPVVAQLAGREHRPRLVTAVVADGWRSPASRRQYLPVKVAPRTPVEQAQRGETISETTASHIVHATHHLGSGSHLIASLHRSNGLAIVPEDATDVPVGTTLQVLLTGEELP